MIKPKIYLDTSVISHLMADDTPDKKNDTLKLWEQLKKNDYEVIISNITTAELDECNEPLREKLYSYLKQIDFVLCDETVETITLAEEYLNNGVLTRKSEDDCRHITVASVIGCKYILSWNFKHFVNIKTIEMVREINKKLGFVQPDILPPTMFLESEE